MRYPWKDIVQFTNWELHRNFLNTTFSDDGQFPKIEKAISIVSNYHDEPRMDGTGNMKVHLLRVARILVEELGVFESDVVLIGLLHDVLEDTSVTEMELKEEFGDTVMNGVVALTRPREKDWHVYANEIVVAGDMDVILVKIADKLDNARSHWFSKNETMRQKDLYKTNEIVLPIVRQFYPELETKFQEVIAVW